MFPTQKRADIIMKPHDFKCYEKAKIPLRKQNFRLKKTRKRIDEMKSYRSVLNG